MRPEPFAVRPYQSLSLMVFVGWTGVLGWRMHMYCNVLAGIQNILNGIHQASAPLSASSRGQERQAFIDHFLSNVLPPIYRFGTGDATAANGVRSGQLDVVVEYPFAPTLPSVGAPPATRLYLAEGVAAVIEVKSNVANQWAEAQRTATLLAPVQRAFAMTMVMGGSTPTPQIPLFVAGYVGWSTPQTVQQHLAANPTIAGILVIDPGIFVSANAYGGITATGPLALWALIASLHLVTTSLQAAIMDPISYAQ